MKVLVCGGRDYDDSTLVEALLSALLPSVVIHGGAPGADRLAAEWARRKGVTEWPFPADWKRYGRRAGYLRNAQMLSEGHPDVVLAFPGGAGTRMMVDLARQAGVRVIQVRQPATTSKEEAS